MAVTHRCVCGKTFEVAEDTERPVFCPMCGHKLELDQPPAEASRLKLASMQNRASLVSADIPPETQVVPVSSRRENREAGRFRAAWDQRRQTILAWALFLVLLAILLCWQQKSRSEAGVLKSYLAARWVLATVAWLLVIVPAFLDRWVHGIFCLLVPPYAVYYAFHRLPQCYFRAIFFAVLLALAAEYYFFPDTTLLGVVQARLSAWTATAHSFGYHSLRTLFDY